MCLIVLSKIVALKLLSEESVLIKACSGAFKMNFQIVIRNSPNSIHNTCVFACEAKETIANFHIALDRYKDEVMNLGTSQWK